MVTLNDYFEKIYCVNLDRRTDRWNYAKELFLKNNLQVDRISGIDGSLLKMSVPDFGNKGSIGFSLSQLFTIKLAKQNNLKNFLLLEDDVVFDESINCEFFNIAAEIPSDWDMLYLGGQHFHGINLKQITGNVYKCEYTLTTHSVAFKNTVYDYFIDKILDLSKPADVHYAESHKEINAYVIIPHLTWQKSCYSDIMNENVDYTYLKQHRYPEWGKP